MRESTIKRVIRYLSRAGHRILALGAIRAPIRLFAEITHQNLDPAPVGLPAARNILVLAPHMDDETIGCGGTLLAHAALGRRIEVMFMTDGAAGFDASVHPGYSRHEKVAIRRREAERACKLLGVAAIHRLDLPDGRLEAGAPAVETLRSLIDTLRPDIVYLPFLTDAHHDHRVTNQLFVAAVKQRSDIQSLLCCGYEVWTPLHANCIVDITDFMEKKLAVLSSYESQLQMNDYRHSIRGLNAYRSIANRSRGYAEAFYLTTAKAYLAIAEESLFQ